MQTSSAGEYTYDKRAADVAAAFFERLLRHTKGEWSGVPFALQPWQRDEIIRPLFGWKRADGTRRYRRAYIEIPRKNGKALALDTPIPTPTGWTAMGNLQVGDMVFDEHGQPYPVIAATDVMYGRPCYRVEFSDSTSIVADAEHLWRVIPRRTGRPGGAGLRGMQLADYRHQPHDMLMTTQQIADTLTVDSPHNVEQNRVEWNHRIPLAGPIQTTQADLPVPPYTFGAWLGDGNSDSARITVGYGDLEIVSHITGEGVPVREGVSSNQNSGIFALSNGDRTQAARDSSVAAKLRSLGVIGNKHIPMLYLRGSIEQRMALLRGLMDTDGCVSKAGQCAYTTTSKALCDGVVELLRGLGYKPTVKTATARLYGRDIGPKFSIQFFGYKDRSPFGLQRKTARLKEAPHARTRSQTRQIVAVNPVLSVPVRCIQTAAPTGMFLAGDGMVPTHNSTLAAGLALLLLFADNEPGAEIYSCAVDRDQAAIVFESAKAMVEASPQLQRYADIFKRSIVVPSTRSSYKVLSADAPSKHGLNAHGIVFDELHAQPNRELWDVMTTSMGARRQPLLIAITTAGYDRESICWEQHEYARQVLNGTIDDPSFFAYIAAASDDDDWLEEATWRKANPAYGVTVKAEYLETEAQRAKQVPAYQNTFRRLHLNQWTQQDTRWLDLNAWDACAFPVSEADLAGRHCYAGLDLASSTDVAALALVFPPEDETEPYQVVMRFWVPRDNLVDRARRDRVPYDAWARDGHLTATAGSVIDYATIMAEITALSERYELREVAFDRWGAVQMAQELEASGLTMIAMGQGMASMSPPTKELLRLVLNKRIAHGGQPVLRWMADNMVVRTDPAGNVKPDKQKSREKIDGMVALIMALDRATRHTDPRSIYETRELRVL